jgi:hypothetical protein
LLLMAFLGAIVGPHLSRASTIDISGVAANWLVTGAGASNAVPYVVNGHITITSTQNESGTFVSGGSLAGFDGFWFGVDSFSLPADATNVSITFASFQSDDRAVLELNGTIIGNSGNGAPGIGSINLTDGGTLQAFNFTNVHSGTVTTGFNPGGINSLVVIVNNTSTALTGSTTTFQNSSDNTYFKLSGTVTYSDVPELQSAVLALTGAILMAFGLIRRRPRSARQRL